MENSVREFASEVPNADYAAITKRLGTPEKIAESYVMEMDTAELVQGMKVRQKVMFALVSALAVFLTVWIIAIAATYLDHRKDMNGYAVVEIVEIENIIYEGEFIE